ncbi:MAG: MFS transporter [Cellvibrio sp.]|nr:MFS transporter [Cellvibrio sp.]
MYQNAILLGLCQFLFMASVSVGLSFTGIVGEKMASSTALSTLPFLTMTATTALLTLYVPKIFAQWGYKRAFVIGTLLGSLGGCLPLPVFLEFVFLFCTSGILTGCYQASALYYRFAAADSVSNEYKSKAIAWVLNGGILAALIGPLLGKYSLHLFSQDYLGSYLLVACLALMVLPFVGLTKLPPRNLATTQSNVSVWQLIRYPRAIAVILLSAGGYAMMMMVMLASPLAMNHCGYHASDAASVIQWHLLGMFAPSLITGSLINRYGSLPIGVIGCLMLIGGCAMALSGLALTNFHWGLMLVGVGWNFMYMSGTTLIMQWSDLTLRSRLQSVNEFITFGVMTITAGGTGWLYQLLGWQSLLFFAITVTGSLLVIVFWQKRHKDTF